MPSLASPLSDIAPSPLVAVQQLLRDHAHALPVGLHQGKTVFEPCARPRVWERADFGISAHEHAPPAGVPALREAFAAAASARRGATVDVDQVLVTGGATHAIGVVLRAVLAPGDEVVILSPQWLFATGLVRAAGGVPREVPVFLELCADPGFDFLGAVEQAVTDRTRAIYFNNPNNPTGFRLDEQALAGLTELAERHDLWLIADNAYENYDFSQDGFLDSAAVGRAAERTFSVHTCSKTYAMPGARVGHLVSPPGCEEALTKWSLHTLYSVSTPSQFAAYEALATPESELADRRARAYDAWRLADEYLDIPHTAVSGTLYTFLDLSALGDGERFVRSCAENGVGLAPGRVFGEHCRDWARICFTAAPPEAVRDAVQRINKVYKEAISER
ncbi:pyridoxal phosphate-dependent aminotransferase [Streptomyces smyrnaeus]|uniref:Pyridoxal phosphate-dependent aminotransferase n=1 Tax=Streptomyces smyrnaeus TaxID=1387713 RepID=A0ABS3XTQ0_9ACTN|nr:pyridoxal phosphate-dependent aminotransferase [Streptomyces smyrnaeus]MBO8198471.1 pyridoxal phosphate-dependent aminotransferase [Streptomyces smyrnaeus]